MWLKYVYGENEQYSTYINFAKIARLEVERNRQYRTKYNAVTEYYEVSIYDVTGDRGFVIFETEALAEKLVKNIMYVVKGTIGSMLLNKPVILTVEEVFEMNFEEDE